MSTTVNENAKEKGQGPKFLLDIEGTLVPWDHDTITTEQIIQLGGWDASQGNAARFFAGGKEALPEVEKKVDEGSCVRARIV